MLVATNLGLLAKLSQSAMEDLASDIDSAEDIYGLSGGDRRLTIAVNKQVISMTNT